MRKKEVKRLIFVKAQNIASTIRIHLPLIPRYQRNNQVKLFQFIISDGFTCFPYLQDSQIAGDVFPSLWNQ